MEELYSKAVGALGISPLFFYDMTFAEVMLAYKGYLEKMQMTGNMMLMAVRQWNAKKVKPFEFIEDNEVKSDKGWQMSTIEKRNEVFSALGVIERR